MSPLHQDVRRNFRLNLGLMLAGLASASSGLTIQLKYHLGRHGQLDPTASGYPIWTQFHKISSVLLLVLVLWHLGINWRWLRTVWRKGLIRKHKQVISMSLIFLVATLTGMGAWATSWTDVGFRVERLVVEIHDKLTLFLAVFLFLHVWGRRKRLTN